MNPSNPKPAGIARAAIILGALFAALMGIYLYCEYLGQAAATTILFMLCIGMNAGCLILLHIQNNQLNDMRTSLASAALDLRMINELRRLTKAEVTAVIRNYLTITPKLLSELGIAIANHQPQEIVRVSNRLWSAGAQMGAVKFSALTRDLEYSARAGDLEPAPELYAEAVKAYGHVDAALHTLEKQ